MTDSRLPGADETYDANSILPPHPEDGFTIKAPCGLVPVSTSFPIAPTIRGLTRSPNPFFSFMIPTPTGPIPVQWQIHPMQHGLERYTLVNLTSGYSSSSDSASLSTFPSSRRPGVDDIADESKTLAVYHHVGVALSLAQADSEGVLLLPDNDNPALEALVVTSLLGMLWQIRAMDGRNMKKEKSHRRAKTLLGRAVKAVFHTKGGRQQSL